MFTTGRIVFTVAFALVFIAALIWSYRREKTINATHFRAPWKILLALVGFIALLWMIVKIRKFL
jgi:hypothetical protein